MLDNKVKNLTILVVLIIVMLISTYPIQARKNLSEKLEKLDNQYRKYYYYAPLDSKEREKKVKEATEEFERLLEIYPKEVEIYWRVAECYNVLGNVANASLPAYKEGKKYAKKSLELDPDGYLGYFWSGVLIARIGQEEGIFSSLSSIKPMREKLEKSIELNPEFGPAYDVLSQLYLIAPGWPISIGDIEKALEYQKEAVRLAPRRVPYLWELYEIYKEIDNESKAEEILVEIIDFPLEEAKNKEAAIFYKERAKEELNEPF